MCYNLRVKGNRTIKVGGTTRIYANEVEFGSRGLISYHAENHIYGEPENPPKKEIIESASIFESTYIHDHLLSVAREMVGKFNIDDKSILYKFYKALDNGRIVNPPIVVTSNLHSGKALYDLEEQKIVIWETSLIGIEKNEDKKIKLLASLTECYSTYLNHCLKELSCSDDYETYEYDLFRFDALGDETIIIGKLDTPHYKGNIELKFEVAQQKKFEKYEFKPEKDKFAHGPNASEIGSSYAGEDDPPVKNPNIGIKFSYSLQGGFVASIFVGLSKSLKSGDFGATGGLNLALTGYALGAIGTSEMSPTLVTLSATPSMTLGYKTGNALRMNLFNEASGSGVFNPYEYAFTVGSTGILSSGKVSMEFNPETGRFGKNGYNSFDFSSSKNRNQILGGIGVKIADFMVCTYNDIKMPPLLFGMGSDQYWSAGINVQAELAKDIKLAYSVDMHYGKANHNNPFNLDKSIEGQNYDYQQLFDLLLNRGQEKLSITDASGNITTQTRYGYGTFWPSNRMHDAITFPIEPKKPEEPDRKKYDSEFIFREKYAEYEKKLESYNKEEINYKTSIQLKAKPTFHHLYVVYDLENKVDLERLKQYLYAGQLEKGKLLKQFYELDLINTKL